MRRFLIWPCAQIDFSWRDVAFALRMCLKFNANRAISHVVPDELQPTQTLVLTSVRAAFDLYLNARAFEQGDACVFVGLNVPGMYEVAVNHGLTVVSADIDPHTGTPNLTHLNRCMTKRTRCIVVSHLFGHRTDIHPIVEIAHDYDIDIVEDCAQAFDGSEWRGSRDVAISLFSFGLMKTATALQGGIAVVRDPALGHSMSRLLGQYRRQPNWQYVVRLLRGAVLKIGNTRTVYSLTMRLLQSIGVDHEQFIHARTMSVGSGTTEKSLRLQPCYALTRVLHRKIQTGRKNVETRIAAAERLCEMLGKHVRVFARRQHPHAHWMFPVVSNDPDGLKTGLRAAGFDACSARLQTVPNADTPGANVLANAVLIPFASRKMSESDLTRLSRLLTQHEQQPDSTGN